MPVATLPSGRVNDATHRPPEQLATVAVPSCTCPTASHNGSALTQPKNAEASANTNRIGRPIAARRVVAGRWRPAVRLTLPLDALAGLGAEPRTAAPADVRGGG